MYNQVLLIGNIKKVNGEFFVENETTKGAIPLIIPNSINSELLNSNDSPLTCGVKGALEVEGGIVKIKVQSISFIKS